MKSAYLGPEGSYTHQAAKQLFLNDILLPVSNITSIIKNFDLADRAIVPVENSIAGGVSETIEALQKSDNLYINQEYSMPIQHHLLAIRGKIQNWNQIKTIYAHNMTLGQCLDFIRSNFDQAQIMPSPSNSAAAKQLAEMDRGGVDTSTIAVFAPRLCAEIYDLEILSDSVSDSSINQTRFWILSREIPSYNPAAKNKTTIIFETKDEPGSLQTVLRLFAVNNINLSRIESRPAKKNLGEYMFLIDFDLHCKDSKYDDLIRQAKKHFTYFKWLGSYSTIE